MYHGRVFLGFCLDASIEDRFDHMEPSLKALLTSGGDYFDECNHNGHRWLGRYVDNIKGLQALDLVKNNLVSLQQRFITLDSPPKELWLFPLVQSKES
jgi:hypothetical protein